MPGVLASSLERTSLSSQEELRKMTHTNLTMFKIMSTGNRDFLGIRDRTPRYIFPRYNANGDFEKALPSLLQVRSHHACAWYRDAHTGGKVSNINKDGNNIVDQQTSQFPSTNSQDPLILMTALRY